MAHFVTHAWHELDVARYKSELYRMWHVGYRAGLGHERVFSTMGAFRRSPTVEHMRRHLLRSAQQRDTLAGAVKAGRDLFVPFEAALLELGEESGGLEEILDLLGRYFESEHRMNLWVKRKLAYPMMNTVAAIFIAPFPVLFFGNAVAYALTVITGLVFAVAAGGGLLAAAARSYRNRPKVVLARLCRALAAGVEAGLSLDRVVQLAVDATGSRELAAQVGRIPPQRLRGQPLAATFSRSGLVPHEVVAALQVAHETGDYTNTLKKLADLYEDGF